MPSSTVFSRRPQQVRSVTSHTTWRPIACTAEDDALFKPREILLQGNDYCSSILLTALLIWSRNECPHYVLKQRSRATGGIKKSKSSIPTNATHPHYRGHVSTNLAVAPLHISIKPPITTHQFVACALSRMT